MRFGIVSAAALSCCLQCASLAEVDPSAAASEAASQEQSEEAWTRSAEARVIASNQRVRASSKKEANAKQGEDAREYSSSQLVVQSAGFLAGNYAKFWVHGTQLDAPQARGFNVVVLNPATFAVERKGSFDTYGNPSAAPDLVAFLASVPTGHWVLVAVRDEGSHRMTPAAYEALKSIGGSGSALVLRGAFALVGKKGSAPTKGEEAISVDPSKGATAEVETTAARHAKPYRSSHLLAQSAGAEAGNYAKFWVKGVQLQGTPQRRGFNVVVLNPATFAVEKQGSFDTHGNPNAAKDLVAFLASVPTGHWVLVAVLDEGQRLLTPAAYEALKSIGGSGKPLAYKGSFALVGKKGSGPGKGNEQNWDNLKIHADGQFQAWPAPASLLQERSVASGCDCAHCEGVAHLRQH